MMVLPTSEFVLSGQAVQTPDPTPSLNVPAGHFLQQFIFIFFNSYPLLLLEKDVVDRKLPSHIALTLVSSSTKGVLITVQRSLGESGVADFITSDTLAPVIL